MFSQSSVSASDLSRDEIQCLFVTHDDLIETIYQTATPAVHDIFRTMSREASKQTDSQESLAALLEDGLSKCSEWNRLCVREVTRSWSKLSRVLIVLIKKICKIKALIMKKNGLIPDAHVDLTLEFSSILHAMIVFSSVALIEDMESYLKSNGSQASTEIIMRKHQAIEKAVVHLVRDALNEKLLETDDRDYNSEQHKPSGLFPTNFASVRASDANDVSESVSVLRYSVPRIEGPPAVKSVDEQKPEAEPVFKFDTNEEEEDVDISDMLDEDFPPNNEAAHTSEPSEYSASGAGAAHNTGGLAMPAVEHNNDADPVNETGSRTVDISTDHDSQHLDLKYSPLVQPAVQQQQQVQRRTDVKQAPSNSISRDLARILLRDL